MKFILSFPVLYIFSSVLANQNSDSGTEEKICMEADVLEQFCSIQ
jgi:hypothetical protein